MDARNLTAADTEANYEDAKLRHIAAAIDRIMATADPLLCACGSRKTFAWERECTRCWISRVGRQATARAQRRQDLGRAAEQGDADAAEELHVLEEQEREREERAAREETDEEKDADYQGDIERDRSVGEG